jgi:formate-nitrite transporter family protein
MATESSGTATEEPRSRQAPGPTGAQKPEPQKERQVQEAESLDAKSTYEVVRREGLEELDRPTSALLWSGLAAGLSMGFSFLAEGFLRTHLPDASWRPLVAKLGYSVGFVIVILGSQQLFTENTLTPIVPLLSHKSREMLRNVARLWGAVLVANLIGAFLFAFVLGRFAVVEPDVQRTLSDLSHEALKYDVLTTMLHAVFAGWLIALMVWMLPGAESSKFAVIVVMTWLVGVGGWAHIIAGGTEVMYGAVRGEAAWSEVSLGYLLPTLVGNVLGGVTLVAALNHAQATSGD